MRPVPSLALAAALMLSGCSAQAVSEADGAPEPSAAAPATLPDGWRWESYGDAEVGVPGRWATGYMHVGNKCAGSPDGAVNRPATTTDLVLCIPGPDADELTIRKATVAGGGTFVAFIGDRDDVATEGDRLVVRAGRTGIVIQAQEKLRNRIAATVHEIGETNAHGCLVDDPIARSANERPTGRVALADLVDVTAVAACRYAIPASRRHPVSVSPALRSSLRLTGRAAADAVAVLSGAPRGGGPNAAWGCGADRAGGDEAIVLRVSWGGDRQSRIHVRYSGCDHNGVDDGVNLRRLTVAAVPFLSGPNRPDHATGRALDILRSKKRATAPR